MKYMKKSIEKCDSKIILQNKIAKLKLNASKFI